MRWASPREATLTVNGAPRKDSANRSVHTPAFGNGTSIVSAEPLKFRITMAYSSGPAGPSRRMAVKGDQLAALQRLLPVVERLAAAQSPARATQLTAVGNAPASETLITAIMITFPRPSAH